jgi:hypothetical protein
MCERSFHHTPETGDEMYTLSEHIVGKLCGKPIDEIQYVTGFTYIDYTTRNDGTPPRGTITTHPDKSQAMRMEKRAAMGLLRILEVAGESRKGLKVTKL